MKITGHDAIAKWSFYSKKGKNTAEYSNIEYGGHTIWAFWTLKSVLEILNSSKLLIINRLRFAIPGGSPILDIEDSAVDNVLNIIVSRIHNNEILLGVTFLGSTILIDDNQEISYDNIVSLNAGLSSCSLQISVFSDCWVPIDRDDKLQLDLAENNSPRLTKALREIKDLGYEFVYPDIGQEFYGELQPQYGFKIFLTDSAINFVEIEEEEELSEEEIKIIEKYLWKNRLDESV